MAARQHWWRCIVTAAVLGTMGAFMGSELMYHASWGLLMAAVLVIDY